MLQGGGHRPSGIGWHFFRPNKKSSYPNGNATPTDPSCPASVCALRVPHIAIRPLSTPKPLQIDCIASRVSPASYLCHTGLCVCWSRGEGGFEADELFGLQIFVIGLVRREDRGGESGSLENCFGKISAWCWGRFGEVRVGRGL